MYTQAHICFIMQAGYPEQQQLQFDSMLLKILPLHTQQLIEAHVNLQKMYWNGML